MAEPVRPPQGAPNPTVYVHNLDEKIKPAALKENLSELFSVFGTILDVIAKRSLKRKGQAFVVFDDTESAATAIEELNDFEVNGKPMHLEFARTRSDAIVKQSGNEAEFEAHKRTRLAQKERKQAQEAAAQQAQATKRPAPEDDTEAVRPSKNIKVGVTTGAKAKGAAIPDEYNPPNKTLFVQNIPEGIDADALTALFSQYTGFKEVRTVPFRPSVAFVEYDTEASAITAKENTAGMPLGTEGTTIKVVYQRQ